MDEKPNRQTATIAKHLPAQQPHVRCPWISRAPLSMAIATKSNQSPSADRRLNNNNHHNQNACAAGAIDKEVAALANGGGGGVNVGDSTLQNSSSQFFHFLRLMQLFPDVHPATLHSVMILCKNDFFGAVDKLLYAKRCKNYYMNQMSNGNHAAKIATQQHHRYQPYRDGNVKQTNEAGAESKPLKEIVGQYRHVVEADDYSSTNASCTADNANKPVDLKVKVEDKAISQPLNISNFLASTSAKPRLINNETTLISL